MVSPPKREADMTTTEYKTRLEALDEQAAKLRADLTPEERERALRIGRIEFASAGATRKR